MKKRRRTLREKREETERVSREREEFEAKHKADREAAEREARERLEKDLADRAAREAERKEKEKALDDKITALEVELTSLEKTYLETTHILELKQLELMAYRDLPAGFKLSANGVEQPRRLDEAKALATALHHLRCLIIARTKEHEVLVKQRPSVSLSPWSSVFTKTVLIGVAGILAYSLFNEEMKRSK